MMTLVLSNPALRYRLVTEASEHVLRFDWADAGRQTAALYGALGRPRPRPRAMPRPAMPRR
jgi:glycogen(starch) synthase